MIDSTVGANDRPIVVDNKLVSANDNSEMRRQPRLLACSDGYLQDQVVCVCPRLYFLTPVT